MSKAAHDDWDDDDDRDDPLESDWDEDADELSTAECPDCGREYVADLPLCPHCMGGGAGGRSRPRFSFFGIAAVVLALMVVTSWIVLSIIG